uniref:Uncharacterized protein n=1 Tax=Eptatretus burgeri TaxID=7764 RepID=A0A8C4QUK2_EPTBU
MENIRWTDKEYSLQEFEEQFAGKLPIIIKVTDGYMGQQELDTISAETVWLNMIQYSKRLLAEDSTGMTLSIPLNIQKPKFYSLSQHGCKEGGYDGCILLTLHPMVIPAYIRPLKVTVAEGLLDDNPDEWLNFCDYYQRCTSSLSDFEDRNILGGKKNCNSSFFDTSVAHNHILNVLLTYLLCTTAGSTSKLQDRVPIHVQIRVLQCSKYKIQLKLSSSSIDRQTERNRQTKGTNCLTLFFASCTRGNKDSCISGIIVHYYI